MAENAAIAPPPQSMAPPPQSMAPPQPMAENATAAPPQPMAPQPMAENAMGPALVVVVPPPPPPDSTMTFLCLILAILLPPLGVFLKYKCEVEFWICLVLTFLAYAPGIIYAIWVIVKP